MRTGILLAIAMLLCSCAPGFENSLGTISSSLLSSAGVGGGSADSYSSLFDAGSKLTKAARGLNDEQEYYLGRGVSAVILSKYSLVRNDALTRYVNKVGNSVAIFSERPETFGGYHFGVLDSSEINAVSAPGGFVFITKGFLRAIPDEDALAAVLAHEVGHIVKGHGTAAISQANITSALTAIGKSVAESQGGLVTQQIASNFGDSITDVTNSLLEKGYSRSQEYEADQYAAELLGAAGYNQMAIVSMLESLKALDGHSHESGWYATHPTPEKREDEVKDEVELVDLAATAEGAKAQKARATRFKAIVKG